MLCIASGGNGGTGAIGANSTAAGGGGGGSGSQSTLVIPVMFLPDVLYVSCAMAGAGGRAVVAQTPNNVGNSNILSAASAGGSGGNASGATAGAAGAAGGLPAVSSHSLSGIGIFSFIAGQAGIIGGTTVAGAALTLPTTGLIVTGGTGGGGLPAAAATGTNGGSFTVPAAPTIFVPQPGGVGPSVATNPADPGAHGFQGLNGLLYSYGGAGSSSTHGTATGGGLVQAAGGNGGPGSGGGGMGGALTGSTAAVASLGGEAFCAIICW